MCAGWIRLGILGIAFAAAAGCLNTGKSLKPPKNEPEYIFPPTGDPRFTNYPTYPARVMGEGRIKVEQVKDAAVSPGFTQGGGPH